MSNPAYVRSDNVNAVVYRGTDNDIHEIALPLGGAAWQHSDLSALTSAPGAVGDPGGYVRSDQVDAVVYPFIFSETDNDIEEIALPLGGTAWKASNLTAPPVAFPATPGGTRSATFVPIRSTPWCIVDAATFMS